MAGLHVGWVKDRMSDRPYSLFHPRKNMKKEIAS